MYIAALVFLISIGVAFPLSAQNNKKQSFSQIAISQTGVNELKPLTVGEKVPDLELKNILNIPSGKARISAFKNKLLLIDFWGTTCRSCLSALPKFDSLQKKFKDRIQVLTVTNYDTEEKVKQTFSSIKILKNVQLPVVLNDLRLKQIFPHEIVSHLIWIDGSGTVRAITGTEYLTGENIEKILKGENTNWPVKNDVMGFDYQKPFLSFSQSSLAKPGFMYNSAFTGYIEGVDATDKQLIDSNNQTITRNYFNHTLLQLCDGSLVGSGTGFILPKNLVLEVKDPTRYIRDESKQYYAEWAKENTFSYSITLPLSFSVDRTKEIIKTDLTHWLNVLGIYVKKEKRTMPALLLVRKNNNDELIRAKGDKYEWGLNNPGQVKTLHSGTIGDLVWYLNNETAGIPWVFDETGIAKDLKVDLNFKIDSFHDIKGLKKELQRYGLDLVEKQRERDIIVITEMN